MSIEKVHESFARGFRELLGAFLLQLLQGEPISLCCPFGELGFWHKELSMTDYLFSVLIENSCHLYHLVLLEAIDLGI